MLNLFRRLKKTGQFPVESLAQDRTPAPNFETLEDRTVPATFTVTNLNDAGAGSLRQAVIDANNGGGADIVDFQAGLTGTIVLTTGEIAITDIVDIQGPGAAAINVSGNANSRHFFITADTTISGMTLNNGNGDGTYYGFGGSILSLGADVTIRNSTISGNSGLAGGAVYFYGGGYTGSLTVENSVVENNTTGYQGSAFASDAAGALTIRGSTIQNNSGTLGAIFTDDVPVVLIENSTISGNNATFVGGGVFFYENANGFANPAYSLTIRGSTISGNNSAGNGGGIYMLNPDNPVTIENSTLSGNTSGGDGGGIFRADYFYSGGDVVMNFTTIASNNAAGAGGGVQQVGGPTTLTNSIVADNVGLAGLTQLGTSGPREQVNRPVKNIKQNNDAALHGTGPNAGSDIGTGALSIGFSLIEDAGTATITDLGGNIIGQDPQLGALVDNGGLTLTHLPAATSPVVDAGNPAFAPPPATDQRGTGFPRVNGARVDMGAVETGGVIVVPDGPLAVLTAAPNVDNASDPDEYRFSVTYTDPDLVDVQTIGTGDIVVTGPNGYTQVAVHDAAGFPTVDTSPIVPTYSVVPPGGTWTTTDNGVYTITLIGGEVLDTLGNPANGAVLGTFIVAITEDMDCPFPDGTDESFLCRLYRDVLQREFDAEGLEAWAEFLQDPSHTRRDVVDFFLSSEEFHGVAVRGLYNRLLGRDGTAAEVQGWVDQLNDGRSLHDVTMDFLGSDEYAQLHPVPDDYVAALYQDLLGRAPTAQETADWSARLAGEERRDIAGEILNSEESALFNIGGLYEEYLNRNADTRSQILFAKQFVEQKDSFLGILGTLLASDEYYDLM